MNALTQIFTSARSVTRIQVIKGSRETLEHNTEIVLLMERKAFHIFPGCFYLITLMI